MALQKFTDDMHIIAKLDDEPNDVGGLTATELKAKFDEGGVALQRYINETMLPQLETMGVEQAVLLPENAGGFKYMRLNGDKVLEVSADGSTWQATGSSGHLIFDKYGKQMPQRSRTKFANSEVTDDGTYTIVQGVKDVNGVTPDTDGNITLSAGSVGAVGYNTPQALTDAQKQQARDNINAPAPYEAGDNISITGRIITTKAFPCNPGLTDNWYFGNPVNQRGQTSYTGTGYGIDRWKLDSGESVTIDNGLNIVKANSYIGQYFDDFDKYIGRQLVGSVLMSDGNLYTGTYIYNGILNQVQVLFANSIIDMYIQKLASALTQVEFNTAIDNVKVLATKLELGSQQTLAHKEYGEWVLNEIPKFGDQLAECQRYYYRVHYTQYQTINMAYEDTHYSFIMLPLPVAMRIDNPVLTQSKPITLGISEKILTVAEANGCMARLGVNYTAISNTQKAVYSYCADPEGVTFELSADL